MARHGEGERDASKTAGHQRSAERKTDVSVEVTRKHGETGTGERSGRDERTEKRTERSKDEKHKTRHKDESGKESRRGGSDDKTAREEVRANSRSSNRKDQLEDKREDRSGDKSQRRDGSKEKKDDRSPLEPQMTNAVEGKRKKASKELMCEVCEHRDATLWCGDCGDIFYCRKCADADHSRGKRKEHLPLRPAEKAPQRAATKVVKCEEHGEILRAYCETDRKAVCSLCLHIGNHKGHSAIELDKAVRAARDSIRKEAGDLILERQKVDTFLDELEEIAESLKKNGAELREHLRTTCDSFRAVLTEREAALLVQVDERESEKTSIIGRQRVRWKDTNAEVNKARDLAEAALKEADPVVLLKKRDSFEQQAHALRIAAARRSATPATTASLDLALEADPIVSLIRESLVFSSGASVNRAFSVIARLQQAQSQKASLTDNTVVVLPRGCLEVAHVAPNLATNPDSSSPDAWIGRLWELREHVATSEASKAAALELSRTRRKGKRDQPEKENEAAVKAAMKIQARWRGASLRKANSLEVLKAFRGCGVRGSVVYTLEGDVSDGADERYVKMLANLGCLVVLSGRQSEAPSKRAPSLSSRNPSGPSPLKAWLEAQDHSDVSVDQEAKAAARISHLVKALPASIRQSGVFLMGHGLGGELLSRAEIQSPLRELVTGTILSGCGQLGTVMAGNVLTLDFKASESSPASFAALVAGGVKSGLTATLPADFLEDVSTSKDGVFRELLLTFLCKPQRIHLLDKLWETEPHLAKQLTVTGRKGNVLSVSIQPTGRITRQKQNGAPAPESVPKTGTPAKEEQKAVANGSKTLERSGSIRKSQPVNEAVPAQSGSGEPQKRAEPEQAETSGAPRSDGTVGASSLSPVPTSAPGASVIPGTNPTQGLNPNLNPTQAAASSSSNNTGSAPPASAPPSATASNPRALIQPGSTLLSTQPGSPESNQPGASLSSRPSFSSSRPPLLGSSYTAPNPPNPAVSPNLTGAYAPSTAASPLTSALGSAYGRSAGDAAATRVSAAQQPPSTGAYVPGASAGRFGQPGTGPSTVLPSTDQGAPRNGLTR